jgi:transcriptional regulator of stress and heat shock response
MKKSLADGIEKYIKVLIARSENRKIEIQRAELAETFACAPSQVTYVLSTRFTPADGYCTESRRGGMGYMRVTQIKPSQGKAAELELLLQTVNDLGRRKLLHDREMALLKHIVGQAAEHVPTEYQDQVCLGIGAGLRDFMEKAADNKEEDKDAM